jgi:hypothetical protein
MGLKKRLKLKVEVHMRVDSSERQDWKLAGCLSFWDNQDFKINLEISLQKLSVVLMCF